MTLFCFSHLTSFLFSPHSLLISSFIQAIEKLSDRFVSFSLQRIRPAEAVALVSYQVRFDISRRDLIEELVSVYLHYFVSISKYRKFIRMKAPSEPILANASAGQTLRKP